MQEATNLIIHNSNNSKSKNKKCRYSATIRQGDVLKLGKVPLAIKEWSYDLKRYEA